MNKLAINVIMDCTTTWAHKFKTRLGLKQYDAISTKKQPVLTKIMSSFEGENTQTQYDVLGYKIGLYFYDNKLATEIDEKKYSVTITVYKIKNKKVIEQELGCKFIRTDPGNLDILNNQLKKL